MNLQKHPLGFLAGGGDMGNLIRAKDWGATPLGPPEFWPQSLRTSVSTCLNCTFPILIWWGPELVKIYNDAYAKILAGKHPWALGSPGRAVWPEIWDEIGPVLSRVMAHGDAFTAEDLRLDLHRNGYAEECYFSFSYSPILHEAGHVAGVFCPVIETTARVFAERRAAFLFDLDRRLRDAGDHLAVKTIASEFLGTHLGVCQAGYAEVQADDEHVLIEGAWDDGIAPSVSGRHRLEDFGAALIADLRLNQVVKVSDVKHDHRTSRPDAVESFASIEMRSFLDVPLLKADRLVAYPFVATRAPRQWTEHEISLLREVAERIWSAVGRIRAENESTLTAEALRHWNEQLESRVAEEIAAREAAQSYLAHAQRMEALGQLAGGIAHDFNNVLQAVAGGLDLIRHRADDPEVVRKFAGMARDAAARGASVTARLLAFARKDELRASPVGVLALLKNLAEILEPTLGPEIAIDIDVAKNVPLLMADKAQLETALVNLAVNARDAMPDGGRLTLRADTETIALGGTHVINLHPGRYVRLTVVDSGVGMDAATVARACEPFFSTKGQGQGTGLGLAMARGFTLQSAGGFALSSTLGHGTTVTLWFPEALQTPEVAEVSGVRATTSADLPAARVLVVDDDRMVREVLAQQLEELGFTILQSSDGLAALSALDAGETVDLLVTDMSMPGMNGLVLTQEARRRRPKLPVLLLTGYVDKDLKLEDAGSLGCGTLVLRKPISGADLAQHAASLLINN